MKEQYADFETAKMANALGYPMDWFGRSTVLNPDSKIFYPDPCEPDNCAQCGKSKNDHDQFDGRPFFCDKQRRLKAILWQELKSWLWENYKIYFKAQWYGELRFKSFAFAIGLGTIATIEANCPITTEIECIKSAILYLYKNENP